MVHRFGTHLIIVLLHSTVTLFTLFLVLLSSILCLSHIVMLLLLSLLFEEISALLLLLEVLDVIALHNLLLELELHIILLVLGLALKLNIGCSFLMTNVCLLSLDVSVKVTLCLLEFSVHLSFCVAVIDALGKHVGASLIADFSDLLRLSRLSSASAIIVITALFSAWGWALGHWSGWGVGTSIGVGVGVRAGKLYKFGIVIIFFTGLVLLNIVISISALTVALVSLVFGKLNKLFLLLLFAVSFVVVFIGISFILSLIN